MGLPRSIDQRPDLVELEPRPVRLRCLQPAPLPSRRVLGQVAVLDRVVEDRAHWLDEWPWAPDHQTRLVRNDPGLWFAGLSHSGAERVFPSRHLAEPIYHLDCLLLDRSARERKVRHYLSLAPEIKVDGSDHYVPTHYLPEDAARLPPVRVPESDLPVINRVLDGRGDERPARRRDAVRVATRAELEGHWPERKLGEDAYRARIELAGRAVGFLAGEERLVVLGVTNEGDECWPGAVRRPLIRVGYRWLREGKTVSEGRSDFTSSVTPGATAITPAHLRAPDEPGDYALEFDLVHEAVRWFDRPLRLHVAVGAPARPDEPAPTKGRSSTSARPAPRRRTSSLTSN